MKIWAQNWFLTRNIFKVKFFFICEMPNLNEIHVTSVCVYRTRTKQYRYCSGQISERNWSMYGNYANDHPKFSCFINFPESFRLVSLIGTAWSSRNSLFTIMFSVCRSVRDCQQRVSLSISCGFSFIKPSGQHWMVKLNREKLWVDLVLVHKHT